MRRCRCHPTGNVPFNEKDSQSSCPDDPILRTRKNPSSLSLRSQCIVNRRAHPKRPLFSWHSSASFTWVRLSPQSCPNDNFRCMRSTELQRSPRRGFNSRRLHKRPLTTQIVSGLPLCAYGDFVRSTNGRNRLWRLASRHTWTVFTTVPVSLAARPRQGHSLDDLGTRLDSQTT
jgi:hypothetical protein